MTTEAEKLAVELTEDIEGFPLPTQLELKAAALLRSQAQEIERLREEWQAAEARGSEYRTNLLHKDREIERLRGHVKYIGNDALRSELHRKEVILYRAWAVIRWSCFGECRTPGVDGLPTPAEVEAEIKTELGENNAD